MCTLIMQLQYQLKLETVSGTLEKEGVVRYEFEIPPHGLSLNVCVSEREIVVYGSTLIPNANPALHDFMFLVGADTCMNVDSPGDSSSIELDKTLFVSLDGVDTQSKFDITVSAIEPPIVTEDDNDKDSEEPDFSVPKGLCNHR